MDIENRYFAVHRLVLSLFGIWPYSHRYSRIINVLLTSGLFAIGMFTLILKVVRTECSIDSVSQYLQFALPNVTVFLHLYYFYFSGEKMKMLIEHVKYDWQLFQPFDVVIAKRHAETARYYTILFLILSLPFPCIQLCLMLAMYKSSKNVNSNQTSSWVDLLHAELPYIDYQRDIIYIMVYFFILMLLTELIIIGAGTLFLVFVQHICGLCSIVGTRLQTIFDNWEESSIICHKRDRVPNVLRSILYHVRVVELTSMLNSLYGPLYFVQFGVLIALLSCVIFQMFQEYTRENFSEAISSLGQVGAVFIGLLTVCYCGQLILDYHNDVFTKSYMSSWNSTPSNVQKLLLTVMTFGSREIGITVTRSKVVSLELFATTIQISVSYFMALNSFRG